jgi:hypothetical protein
VGLPLLDGPHPGLAVEFVLLPQVIPVGVDQDVAVRIAAGRSGVWQRFATNWAIRAKI